MIEKTKEKEVAIKLRRKGLSYSEILGKVPVAKSSLSLWLRSVDLAKKQKKRLTEKKLAAAWKGGEARKNKRLTDTALIKDKACGEIENISKRELWLLGIALYWAEGSKQKEHNVAQVVKFSNSDPRMIKFFLKWLERVCKITSQEIVFRIALHKHAVGRLNEVQRYWADVTGFPVDNFKKFDWKKNKINTKRRNVGQGYFGLLNIYVRRSTNLNRKIDGWIEGICKYSI